MLFALCELRVNCAFCVQCEHGILLPLYVMFWAFNIVLALWECTLFLSCNGFVYHNLLHLHHTEILVYNIGHVHFPRRTVKTCSNLDHPVNQVKPDNYLPRI